MARPLRARTRNDEDFETFARGLTPAPVIRFPRGSRQWRQQYRLQLHLPRAKAPAASIRRDSPQQATSIGT